MTDTPKSASRPHPEPNRRPTWNSRPTPPSSRLVPAIGHLPSRCDSWKMRRRVPHGLASVAIACRRFATGTPIASKKCLSFLFSARSKESDDATLPKLVPASLSATSSNRGELRAFPMNGCRNRARTEDADFRCRVLECAGSRFCSVASYGLRLGRARKRGKIMSDLTCVDCGI